MAKVFGGFHFELVDGIGMRFSESHLSFVVDMKSFLKQGFCAEIAFVDRKDGDEKMGQLSIHSLMRSHSNYLR